MSTNPFAAKVKPKKKPNPFSAKAKAKAPVKTNPFTNKAKGSKTKSSGGASPFAAKVKAARDTKYREQRERLTARVEELDAKYTEALERSSKLFAKVDAMDKPLKRKTQKFADARAAWLDAERKQEIAYNSLHSAINALRRIS